MGLKKGNVNSRRIQIKDDRTEEYKRKREEERLKAMQKEKHTVILTLCAIVFFMLLSFILPQIFG